MNIALELKTAASLFSLIADDKKIIKAIEDIATVSIRALHRGNRIFFAGNGGSAADAQHFAAELVGRFYFERAALPAIALNTDTSMLTAIGNDYGFKYIFSRQLEAHARSGDIFISLSTSGTSENINCAIKFCNKEGITTIGLTGKSGGDMIKLCEHCILVPSNITPRIQEAHTIIGHTICATIEQAMFGEHDHIT